MTDGEIRSMDLLQPSVCFHSHLGCCQDPEACIPDLVVRASSGYLTVRLAHRFGTDTVAGVDADLVKDYRRRLDPSGSVGSMY